MKLCEAAFGKPSQHRSCGLRALYRTCDACPDVKTVGDAVRKIDALVPTVENAIKTLDKMSDALCE